MENQTFRPLIFKTKRGCIVPFFYFCNMNQFDKLNVIVKEKISVADLMNSPLKFTQINEGVGLNNYITDKNIYRPQLALAGYVGLFNFNRVQIFGNTEMYYLRSLPKPK